MQYPQHDLTRLTHQGLEAKEIFSPSGRGRKMPLTSPLIDQAIGLKTQCGGTLSAIAIIINCGLTEGNPSVCSLGA
jgi:hypothetical protein